MLIKQYMAIVLDRIENVSLYLNKLTEEIYQLVTNVHFFKLQSEIYVTDVYIVYDIFYWDKASARTISS